MNPHAPAHYRNAPPPRPPRPQRPSPPASRQAAAVLAAALLSLGALPAQAQGCPPDESCTFGFRVGLVPDGVFAEASASWEEVLHRSDEGTLRLSAALSQPITLHSGDGLDFGSLTGTLSLTALPARLPISFSVLARATLDSPRPQVGFRVGAFEFWTDERNGDRMGYSVAVTVVTLRHKQAPLLTDPEAIDYTATFDTATLELTAIHTPVPEPASAALLLGGLAAFTGLRQLHGKGKGPRAPAPGRG